MNTPQSNVLQKLESANVVLYSVNHLRDNLVPIVPTSTRLYMLRSKDRSDSLYGIDDDDCCLLPVFHIEDSEPTDPVKGLDLNNPQHKTVYDLARAVVFVGDVPVELRTILTGQDLFQSRADWIRMRHVEEAFLPNRNFVFKRNLEKRMYSRIEFIDIIHAGRQPSWATHVSINAERVDTVSPNERAYFFSAVLDIGGKPEQVYYSRYTERDYSHLVNTISTEEMQKLVESSENKKRTSERTLYILEDKFVNVAIAAFYEGNQNA